jgi:hypothetical protein
MDIRSCSDHKTLNYKVSNELAGIWKQAAMICFMIPPRNLTGEPEDIHEKDSEYGRGSDIDAKRAPSGYKPREFPLPQDIRKYRLKHVEYFVSG